MTNFQDEIANCCRDLAAANEAIAKAILVNLTSLAESEWPLQIARAIEFSQASETYRAYANHGRGSSIHARYLEYALASLLLIQQESN